MCRPELADIPSIVKVFLILLFLILKGYEKRCFSIMSFFALRVKKLCPAENVFYARVAFNSAFSRIDYQRALGRGVCVTLLSLNSNSSNNSL